MFSSLIRIKTAYKVFAQPDREHHDNLVDTIISLASAILRWQQVILTLVTERLRQNDDQCNAVSGYLPISPLPHLFSTLMRGGHDSVLRDGTDYVENGRFGRSRTKGLLCNYLHRCYTLGLS